MELANKEDMRDVITTGDESVNKVDKVATPRRPQRESGSCFRCGQKHTSSECWCKTAQCYRCNKKGHIAKMCNQKCDAHNTRYVEDVSQSASADDDICGLGLYTLTSADQRRSGCQVQLLLEGKPAKMEVDTGSAVSIISNNNNNNNNNFI